MNCLGGWLKSEIQTMIFLLFYFFLFVFGDRVSHFRQIISKDDNLHEMSSPISLIVNLLSTELAHRTIN